MPSILTLLSSSRRGVNLRIIVLEYNSQCTLVAPKYRCDFIQRLAVKSVLHRFAATHNLQEDHSEILVQLHTKALYLEVQCSRLCQVELEIWQGGARVGVGDIEIIHLFMGSFVEGPS